MSRIGLNPISIPEGVTVNINGSVVNVKGRKGELNQNFDPDFKIKVEDNVLTVSRPSEQKRHKSLHGLYRSLINNAINGVSEGYEHKLELVGVGYKASNQGNLLNLTFKTRAPEVEILISFSFILILRDLSPIKFSPFSDKVKNSSFQACSALEDSKVSKRCGGVSLLTTMGMSL